MKVVLCLVACLSVALARPQEGAAFTNDAIRQAQSSHLIPANAQIQNVSCFCINCVENSSDIENILYRLLQVLN